MRSSVPFDVDGVSGVVRPLDTLYKAVNVNAVYERLKRGLIALGPEWEPFTDLQPTFVFAVLITGGSTINGYPMPPHSASAEELAAGFCWFANLSSDVIHTITEASTTAALPDTERKFLPPAALTEEEKKSGPTNDKSNETP